MKSFFNYIISLIRKILFFDHILLEWGIRLLISVNIIIPGFPFADHGYPLIVLCLTVIGFWMYIGKLKTLSLFPLLMALFINYQHLTRSSHDESTVGVYFDSAVSMPKTNYTEKEILQKLDLAFEGIPADDFPTGRPQDIKYNFFLDLEHGYCETAGSLIHVYGDYNRWAIVFEKCGYQNRGDRAEIELHYVGNCIDYPVSKYEERNYITNVSNIILISSDEYERIRNKQEETGDFELISPDATQLNIHGTQVKIDHDTAKYFALGIEPREYDNPKKLISFGGIVRYISDTNPEIVRATEQEIKQHIPKDLPKLMTLDKFHFVSAYDQNSPPSIQETYQLIAKVLVAGDTSLWKPTLPSNNHWRNWESGHF